MLVDADAHLFKLGTDIAGSDLLRKIGKLLCALKHCTAQQGQVVAIFLYDAGQVAQFGYAIPKLLHGTIKFSHATGSSGTGPADFVVALEQAVGLLGHRTHIHSSAFDQQGSGLAPWSSGAKPSA